LEHNLDLRIALQRVEVARAWVHQATGARLPQLGVGVGAGVRKFGLYTMDGAGNASTEITPGQLVPENLTDYAIGLEASWEVDTWGRLKSQREAAVARYLSTIEGTRFVITSIVAETAQAYFELVAVDGSLDILESTLKRQERALEAMHWQKQAGHVNELAVQQFASQLANTRALQTELEQRATELENQLGVLLGRAPERVSRNEAALREPNVAIPPGVPSDLLRYRPDIREAELELRATKFDVDAARAAFYPSVNITAGLGLQAFNPRYLVSVPESVTFGVSAGVFAPLINRNALEADFDAASAFQLQALYEYQKTVLNAFAEVSTSLSSVKRLEDIIEQRATQRDALAKSVDTAGLLLNAGQATSRCSPQNSRRWRQSSSWWRRGARGGRHPCCCTRRWAGAGGERLAQLTSLRASPPRS
jgi:NodT family efflux transporter outer membrane factor (OMF) lipoprotein